MSTEEAEGAEVFRLVVKATEMVEQHVSHFLMVGTMTGILLNSPYNGYYGTEYSPLRACRCKLWVFLRQL